MATGCWTTGTGCWTMSTGWATTGFSTIATGCWTIIFCCVKDCKSTTEPLILFIPIGITGCIGGIGAGAAENKAATIPTARSAPTHGITIPTIAPGDKLPLFDFLMIGWTLVAFPVDVLEGVVENGKTAGFDVTEVGIPICSSLLSFIWFNSDSLDR